MTTLRRRSSQGGGRDLPPVHLSRGYGSPANAAAGGGARRTSFSSSPSQGGGGFFTSRNNNNNTGGGGGGYYKLLFVVGLALTLAPWVMIHSSLNWNMSDILDEMFDLQDKSETYLGEIRKLNMALARKREEARPLEQANDHLLFKLQSRGDTVDTQSSLYLEAEKVEEKFVRKIDQIEAAIRSRSKRDLLQKYGEGPTYKVNVTLTEDTGPQSGRWFVIETVPNSKAPHAVDLFLRMSTEYKMYDNLTLMLPSSSSGTTGGSNAGLIHSVPISSHTHEYVEHTYDMVDDFIPQLAFSEFQQQQASSGSDQNPIMEKYSVAFSGIPGGPNFYVNMNPNKNNDNGETCFGKVVQGKLVLDRIMQKGSSGGDGSSGVKNKLNNDNSRLSMHGIESMRFMPSD